MKSCKNNEKKNVLFFLLSFYLYLFFAHHLRNLVNKNSAIY